MGIKTRVTCPKCRQSFDYEFIPGVSITSIRLGNYRYMKCRKCGKWALFNIIKNLSLTQRDNLANSVMIAGIALLIFSGVLFTGALAKHIIQLEIVSIMVLILSIFLISSGLLQRLRKGKDHVHQN